MEVVKNQNAIQWAQEINANLATRPNYLPANKLTERLEKLKPDEKEIILREMRMDRDFYKKILEEPFREKSPNSYRYVEAKIRIEILNRNGKLLKSLIK